MKNENTNEMKPMPLTKEQYLALAKAVYLGNWMANANRSGRKGDPHMEEYESITEYVFSLAPEFGFSKNLERELEGDMTTDTSEVLRLHDEYDEETFWDELCDGLGERDFYNKYKREEPRAMSEEEHFMKLQECIIEWEDELETHGLERLGVQKLK